MNQEEICDVFSSVVKNRRSVRGFLPGEIPQALLEKIFALAQTAPSNCNTQPWLVHVASGGLCQALKESLSAAVVRGEFAMDFPYEGKYDSVFRDRQYDAANQLYTAMHISREDKQARHVAFLRNFRFFDAPHVAFLFMPENFGLREAMDIGMYAQNLMLAMTAFGVASCPQTALGFHADIVRKAMDVPDDKKLLFGISFGYEDTSVLANTARVARADVYEAVKFHR